MFNKINRCRCCLSTNLQPYFDMGSMPLANSLRTDTDPSELYPLKVNVCLDCFHSQLSIVVNPDVLFSDYPYISGVSQTFKEHCRGLVLDSMVRIKKKVRVLDIAANDGTLLEIFAKHGCEVLGVDPAKNLKPLADAKGVPMIWDYWSESLGTKVGKFDIITATNVLAHVNDVDDFLAGCRNALRPNGLVLVEVPYTKHLIEKCEFDTIYHEHLSYFLVSSFRALVNRNGFYIHDIVPVDIHGGSLRFYIKLQPGEEPACLAWFIEHEKRAGLHSDKKYMQFTERVHANRDALRSLIQDRRLRDEKVIGFGASAKGNTCLNYFNIDLDYIVDDTPTKQNKYAAGKNVIILPPEVIRDESEPLNIVVLAWNFYDEVKRRIAKLRPGQTDLIIRYVPEASEELCKWE